MSLRNDIIRFYGTSDLSDAALSDWFAEHCDPDAVTLADDDPTEVGDELARGFEPDDSHTIARAAGLDVGALYARACAAYQRDRFGAGA